MLPVRSWTGLAVVVAAAVVLQTSAMPLLGELLGDVRPDLLMVLVVFLSLRARWQDVFVANCALGLLRDAFSPVPVGTFGLLFLLCGLMAGWIGRRTSATNLVAQVFTAFIAAAICDTADAIYLNWHHGLPSAEPLIRKGLWGAVCTALAMPVVAQLMERPARWLALPGKGA